MRVLGEKECCEMKEKLLAPETPVLVLVSSAESSFWRHGGVLSTLCISIRNQGNKHSTHCKDGSGCIEESLIHKLDMDT